MHILISGFVKVADSEGCFRKQITELLSRFRTTGHDHLRRYGCSIGIEDFELYAGSIPLLLRRVSERDTPPPHYLSRFINQAIEFIRTETDLLYYRLEHPQCFISEPAPQSPLHWSKNTMLSTCRRFFAVSI